MSDTSKIEQITRELESVDGFLKENNQSRLNKIEFKGEYLHINYDRSGIEPAQKKALEKEILTALSNYIDKNKVFLFSSSQSSAEVYQASGKKAPEKPTRAAELKIGHGQASEKRKIPGVKHVVCIGSGKGGVGKSTFSANLAVTLAKQGLKIGLIDADIYGPSQPMLFGQRDAKPAANDDKKILPIESFGVKVISFGHFIHEDDPVVWRGPMLGGVLNQFFFDTQWGELDLLLIDLPPGTGDVQLSMIQNIELDGSIIVSTPQDVALLDARKALAMFDKLKVHVIGMVENMSSFICDGCQKEHFIYGTGGVRLASSELGVGYLGNIGLDLNLRKSADFGVPYMSQEKYKEGKIAQGFSSVAKKLDTYFFPSDTKKKSLLSKIFSSESNKHI